MKKYIPLICSICAIVCQLVFLPNALVITYFIVFFTLALYVRRLALRDKGLTVEKYIDRHNKEVRPILQNIHNTIMQMFQTGEYAEYSERISFGVVECFPYPHYFVDRTTIFTFQKIMVNNNICIYPQSGPVLRNKEFFDIFSDRLGAYKVGLGANVDEMQNNGKSEILENWRIFLPLKKPIDYELIKDIIRFEMQTVFGD